MATITVSKPQAGRQATIQAQAGQTIQLNFTPDQAFPERAGDDLIFRFQDGSSTRIAGFFTDLTRETLPDFVLPDQTTLSGVDFFTAINPDLLPASGGASGGMGDYRDDAGNLVDGLNSMDPLNPVFWGGASEVPLVAAGIEYPSADIDIRIDTEIPSADMTFTNVLFEDARPFQNLTGEAGADVIPGILQIAIAPTGTTAVEGIVLWGFAEGTVLEIGDRTVTIGSPNDRVPLTPAEIAMEIRVYAPNNDSDADMEIYYEVTLSTADVPGVIVPGQFTLVVDAVADKPIAGEGFAEESSQEFTKTGAEWTYNEDGSRSLKAGELQTLTFGVQAGFTDNDGSERHTIVVRGIPSDAGWTLDSTAGGLSGFTQVASAAQSTAGTYWIEADGSWHFNVGNTTDSISDELVFKPGDWTNTGAPINIELLARADEVALNGSEASLDNNTAETPLGKYQVELVEDTPEFISKNGSITISSDETAGVQTSAEVATLGDLKNAAAVAGVLEDLDLDGKNPVSIAQQNIKYNLFSDGSDDIGLSSPSQLALRFEGEDGTDSGWKTTAGDPIFLYFEDGAVVGRTATGDIAFVVIAADNDGNLAGGINNGTVSFIQYMSLQHPTGGGNQDAHNEKMFLPEPLKLVLHDDDGQIATLDVNLNVHDDGPEILRVRGADRLDETFARDFNHDGAWDNFSTSGRIAVNFGADGPADVPFKLDVSDLKEMGLSSGGVELTIDDSDPTNILAKAGDKVVFTLSIDENGVYKYSQFAPLDHPQAGPTRADHDDALRLPFKVIATDGDGDFVSKSQRIIVEDDGPKLCPEDFTVRLAEADLPGGSDSLHFIDNVRGNIGNESIFHGFIGFSYGADGPASMDGPAKANPFSWNLEELKEAGFQTYDAEHKPVGVVWELSPNGLTVIGYAEGDADKTPVLTIRATLTPGGATYMVDQDAPLIHDGFGRDNLRLDVPFRITDGDGDYTDGNLTIKIQDDIPCAGTCDINDMVFEASLRDGGEISTSGHLIALFGADGPADNPVYWNQESITEEVKNFNAIIDGEHVELTVEFGSDGKTFTIYGPDNALVAEGAISQDSNGHWTYSYKQYEPIEHNATGLGDIAKKLDLGYVVEDGDGDKAYNDVDITIIDSRALFGHGYGQFDETDARGGFPLTGEFALKLDYDAPDGIADVNWNQALVQKSLDVYNQQTPAEADGFTCSVSEDGSLLTILQHGRPVLELTLVRGEDGTYTVEYNQLAQMDHPLGAQVFGLSHDEPIPFVLPVNVVDGDNDTTLGTVVVRVDDDGPDPSVGSNVTILQAMGNAILEGLDNLDLSDPQAFFDSIGKAFLGGLTAGVTDPASLLDLALLVTNAFGLDNERTENEGQTYTASLKDLTFGADGPADENAVTWSKEGITALFKLIGLHATGNGGAELTVEGSGQHLIVKSGGISILDLTIDDAGKASIDQLAPLGHNSSALSGLLSGLTDQLTAGLDPAVLEALKAAGMNPDQLLKALDGGNLLLLPLPVIITDHDGDSAPGLVSVVIRDSVPVAYDRTDDMGLVQNDSGIVIWGAEGNLLTGDDTTGNQTDADYRFDGEHKDHPLTMEGGTQQPNGDWVVDGKYGTLTVHPDGSYIYELTEAGKAKLSEIEPETKPWTGYASGDALADLPAGVFTGYSLSGINWFTVGTQLLAGNLADAMGAITAGMSDVNSAVAVDGDSLGVKNGALSSGEALKIDFPDNTSSLTLDFTASGLIKTAYAILMDADGNPIGIVSLKSGEAINVTGADYVLLVPVAGTFSLTGVNGAYSTMPIPQEEFTYTITDGDNDDASAKLTIDINLPTKLTPAALTVDETFLKDGDGNLIGSGIDATAASDPNNLSQSATDSDSFKLPEGQYAALSVHGVVDGVEGDYLVKDLIAGNKTISAVGGHGELTFSASTGNGETTVTYSYTLTGNVDHLPDSGPDQLAKGVDSFGLKIGDIAVGTLNVGVEDDAPRIEIVSGADGVQNGLAGNSWETHTLADDVISGLISGGAAKTGSIDMTGGADGIQKLVITLGSDADQTVTINAADLKAGLAETITGEGGVLTLSWNATTGQVEYSYQPNNSGVSMATDVFTFTVTDGDKDTAYDTLTFKVDPKVDFNFAKTVVDESYLAVKAAAADEYLIKGTHFDENTSTDGYVHTADKSFTMSGTQYESLTINGSLTAGGAAADIDVSKYFADNASATSLTLYSEHGYLTVSPAANSSTGAVTLTYNYTLTENYDAHHQNATTMGSGYTHNGADDGALVDSAAGNHWDEDSLNSDSFTFKIGSQTGTLNITIEDDGLSLDKLAGGNISFEQATPNYNLALCLDLSTSMLTKIGSTIRIGANASAADFQATRLFASIVAAMNTLEAYKNQAGAENVHVEIVGFNANSVPFGPFATYQAAYDALSTMVNGFTITLNANGSGTAVKAGHSGVWPVSGTNYTDGLDALKGLLSNSLALAGETRVYFLSDGEPYPSGAHSSDTWTNYLKTLTAAQAEHLELYTVGIAGVSGTNFNGVLNGAPEGITNDHVAVPLNAVAADYITALLNTVGGLDGHFNLPIAADGIEELGGKAFVQSVVYTGSEHDATGDAGGALKGITVDPTTGLPQADDGKFDSESITIKVAYGEFTFRVDGTYTFKPSHEGMQTLPLNGDTLNFTVTFMDKDGDTIQKTFEYTFEGPPLTQMTIKGGSDTLNVYEDDLVNHLVAGSVEQGDAASMHIETDPRAEVESVDVSYKYGGEDFTLTINPGETDKALELPGGIGKVLFTLDDAGNLSYRVELYAPETNTTGSQTGGSDDYAITNALASLELDLTVHNDKGQIATGELLVKIHDDTPSQLAPDAAQIENNANTHFDGDLNAIWGADGPAVHGATFNLAAMASEQHGAETWYKSGLKSGGADVFYKLTDGGEKLEAFTAAGKPVFTADLNPGTNSYEIDMHAPVDLRTEINSIKLGSVQPGNSQSSGAGNIAYLVSGSPAIIYQNDLNSNPNIAVMAKITGIDPISNNRTQMGTSNPTFDTGEWLKFDYSLPQTEKVTFTVNGSVSGTYTIIDADGQPHNGNFSTVNGVITINAVGIVFKSLTLNATSGGAGFTAFGLNTTKTVFDTSIKLPVEIQDADGDKLAAQIAATFTESTVMAPILAVSMAHSLDGEALKIGGDADQKASTVIEGGLGAHPSAFGGEGDDVVIGGQLHFNDLHGNDALRNLAGLAGDSSVDSLRDALADNLGLLGQGTAADGDNVLHGGHGNDIIIAGGGNDTLIGGEGADILVGGAGNDAIHGGGGNDTIIGGTGDNQLYGGEGNDIFYYEKLSAAYDGQHDTIHDFQLGKDTLQFEDLFNDGKMNTLNLDNLSTAFDTGTHTLSIEPAGDGQSLVAKFGDSSVDLTINSGDMHQNITVVFDSGYTAPVDQDHAMQIIQAMIKEGAI